ALCPLLLVQQCLNACDLAAHLAHLRRVLHAAGGALKAQLEQLLRQLALAGLKLVDALLAKLGCVVRLHSAPPSSIARLMKRVLIGSLCAARRNASMATSRVTPSIS